MSYYRIGEARNDDAIQLMALFMRGMVHMWRGEFVAGCDVYEKCLVMNARAHREFFATQFAEDPYIGILTNFSIGLEYLGHRDRAHALDAEALDEALAIAHPFSHT